MKNKELRNVRALSQVILDQRSEVEQFFLEALEQIKEEIRKKNTIEKKQKKGVSMPGASQNGSVGQNQFTQQSNMSIDGKNDRQNTAKNLADKVDLNDLEWEDRERVLRLLFSKMNAGNPTSTATTRQNMKQSQARDEQLRAISDEGMKQI